MLIVQPEGAEANKAREQLDTIAGQLLAKADGFASGGDNKQALRLYQQIVRDLPKSSQAVTARTKIKNLVTRKGR